MPDREKVIKGLESCLNNDCHMDKCPYCEFVGNEYVCLENFLMRDALALLKEQPQEGCKWCSRKPVFSGSYCLNCDNEEALADGDWTILYMGCDEVGRIRLTACGDGRADYYPKFCPECGKPVNRN